MKLRALATAVLTAVVLSTSGCSLTATQATLIQYSPAEGVNVPNSSGPVQVRNALLVSNDKGTANLVAYFSNETDQDHRVDIQIEGLPPLVVEVQAESTLSLGLENGENLEVPNFTAPIGSTVSTSFSSGDGQQAAIEVPVLDGALDYLSGSVPGGYEAPAEKEASESGSESSESESGSSGGH